MLKFMLDGLQMYYREGFRDVPLTCQAFKQQLVSEKDTIQEFLHAAVEPSVKSDYISVKQLFNSYDDSYRLQQRDKKTRKNMKTVLLGIKRCLPGAYTEKLQYFNEQGKKTSTSNVIVGYKLKQM